MKLLMQFLDAGLRQRQPQKMGKNKGTSYLKGSRGLDEVHCLQMDTEIREYGYWQLRTILFVRKYIVK
jgi:hypothetical protein